MAEPAPRQVHRQPGVLATATLALVALAVLGAFALVAARWDWVAFVVGLGAVVAGLFLRPHVRLDSGGVHLVNPVRTTHLTWPAVDLIETRWNLTIGTPDERDYGSWAIASQRARSSGGTGGVAGMSPGPRLDRLAGARGGATAREPVARSGSSAHVAGRIRAAKEDYERAVRLGALDEQPPRATRAVSPLGALLVLGGVALMVLALFV